jgi:hypothetical protein
MDIVASKIERSVLLVRENLFGSHEKFMLDTLPLLNRFYSWR